MTDASIQCRSGVLFDLLKPTPDMVSIHDIAHHLARINRFVGATTEAYSVAEHCVHVARIVAQVDSRYAMAALLHDAAEAYVGDISAPLKDVLPDYQAIEGLVQAAIHQALDVPMPDAKGRKLIKVADMLALHAEKTALMVDSGPWPCLEQWRFKAPLFAPACWRPFEAETRFLAAYTSYRMAMAEGGEGKD